MSPSGDSVGWDPSTSTPRRRGNPTFRRERPSAASPSPRRASSPAPSSPGTSLGRTSNFSTPRKSAPAEQSTPPSTLRRTKVLGPPARATGSDWSAGRTGSPHTRLCFWNRWLRREGHSSGRRSPRRRRRWRPRPPRLRMRERRPRPARVGNLALDLEARSRKRCYNERVHNNGDNHSGGFLLASSPSVGSLYVLRSSVLKPLPSLLNLYSCAADCLFTLSMRAYLRESGAVRGKAGQEMNPRKLKISRGARGIARVRRFARAKRGAESHQKQLKWIEGRVRRLAG